MQHTFNNTVDMPGLASEFNVLVASHAALLTTLKEVADSKNEERGPPRYAKSYRSSRTPPPAAPRQVPLALPQSEPVIEEVHEELVAAEAKLLYVAKKRQNKWYNFGDPNWSDMKTDEQWKREGGILQDQWVHSKKYDVSYLPPWSDGLSAKDTARLMKDLNTKLANEKEIRENFPKDLDGIRQTTKDIRGEDPNLRGSPGHLTRILVKLMRKSSVSYPNGMNARECVHWWENSVLHCKDILEGFENYYVGKSEEVTW